MTKLPELFEQAVAQMPPGRLSANDVLTTVRFERHRRAVLASAMAAILVGLATLTGAMLVRNTSIPPAGSAPPGMIVWAGRGDADHYYKVANICGYNPRFTPSATPPSGAVDLGTDGPSANPSADPSYQPQPICSRLFASSDGGRTWVDRGDTTVAIYQVLGPEKLIRLNDNAIFSTPSAGADPSYSTAYELSVDGGASWSPLPPDGGPIEAVPADGVVLGAVSDLGVLVFVNSENRVHRLGNLPPLEGTSQVSTSYDGTLWTTGPDLATDRPAVAVSHDHGRTWQKQLLPNTNAMSDPAFSHNGMFATKDFLQLPMSWNGQTAYVTMYDHDAAMTAPPAGLAGLGGCPSQPAPMDSNCWGWQRGFVTHDGGATWSELGSEPTIPSFEWAWVTADDRLVLSLSFPPGSGVVDSTPGPSPDPAATLATTTDGVHYTVGRPPGFPHHPVLVDARFAYTDNDLYVSDDGWSWRKL